MRIQNVPFETLSPKAQALLRQVGAKKGRPVEVQLDNAVALLHRSYRTEKFAVTAEATVKDASWMGSDGENNPGEDIAVPGGAVAMKYSKMGKSGATYSLAVAMNPEIYALVLAKRDAYRGPTGGKGIDAFFDDAVTRAQTLDLVAEAVG